jgi:putative intracellular protease/amidase
MRFIPLIATAIFLIYGLSPAESHAKKLTTGVLGSKSVYTAELIIPYDVFQHTHHPGALNFIEVFIVSPDGKPFSTFEGVVLTTDYSFENAPPVDILVIPSSPNSYKEDMRNPVLLDRIRSKEEEATYGMSLCRGALLLAAAGPWQKQ